MIRYYVEKGIYGYSIMLKRGKSTRFVCACCFKENAKKVAEILNEDMNCIAREINGND